MSNIKKPINENGIVLKIEYKEAFETFTNTKTGEEVKGQPERWRVTVASSGVINEDNGMEDLTVVVYTVTDKEIAMQLRYLTSVRVRYFLSGERPIADTLSLLD